MVPLPCENCTHFTDFTLFRKWKQTKKYYSSSARALQRTQNWGQCSVLHFAERALQSDGDATSVLLCKVNADASFDLDIQFYMKTFKSELATEILQKPHGFSVSLKQPQLSASPRSIPKNTWRSHNTFCLCVLLIGFRLPAGVQPVSLATSNACKPQWYLFLSFLFKARLSKFSQEGLSINSPLADTLRGSNFLLKSWQQPPKAAPLKSALSYFAEFTSSVRGHSHGHKVWETSDAVYHNTWLTTGWRKEGKNVCKTTKQEGTEVLPSLAVTGRQVQYFSGELMGVSFTELLLIPWYSFTNILPFNINAWH